MLSAELIDAYIKIMMSRNKFRSLGYIFANEADLLSNETVIDCLEYLFMNDGFDVYRFNEIEREVVLMILALAIERGFDIDRFGYVDRVDLFLATFQSEFRAAPRVPDTIALIPDNSRRVRDLGVA